MFWQTNYKILTTVVSLLAVSASGSIAVQGKSSEGTFLDRHNFGYLLKRKSEIYVATYQARLIFLLKLPDWRVAFSGFRL